MNQPKHPSTQEIETALGLTASHRRGRWLKRAIAAALVLLLAGAGYWLYASRQTSGAAISYETAAAQIADVVLGGAPAVRVPIQVITPTF